MLAFHGWGKITGGPETWERVGASMANLGISFAPVFWGFMAAFAEAVCSALLILGVFFRPAAALLAVTMAVAVIRHLSIPAGEAGAGWAGASHALELLAVYAGLLLAGAGRYALMGRARRDDTA
jgi:putative oxidoreductase